MVDLGALAKLLDSLIEGCAPGPWHGVQSGDRAVYSWWLDNAFGDSSFPGPDDVAAMFNALPALVRVALASRAYIVALDRCLDPDDLDYTTDGLEDAEVAFRDALAELA
jgi:hypothetical protein